MSPPHTLTLRLARLQDAPAMAAMSRELIEDGLAWRYTPRRMAALIADAETVALVACDASDQVLGFAVMQFGDEHAHLVLLCVRAAAQRHGIGRRLLGWLFDSARVAGTATVALELRADNEPAFAFYRRLGFVETERLTGYYDGRLAARRMQFRLRGEGPAGA